MVEDPLGYRKIQPSETLRIDPATGEIIKAYTPSSIQFRDGDRIRPVAPFLEVFARTGEDLLEPLTLDLLRTEGLAPEDLRWTVTLGNIKAFRRTGDVNDKILAEASFSDHAPHPLEGECANFVAGKPCRWARCSTSNRRRRFPRSGCAIPRLRVWSMARSRSAS